MGHALIVEDDADAASMVAALVASQGHSAATAPTLHDARRQLALQTPDLLLLDLHLPDGNGLTLLEDTDLLGQPDIVLMTGHASLENSIQALRLGVVDYLVKPLSATLLQGMLSRVMLAAPGLARAAKARTAPAGRTPRTDAERFGHLIGRSAPMRRVFEQIARVAGTSVTVFITGESGTGKELVARTVHEMSRRKAHPFLAVNCGAISPTLIESEIFGHERGSFTGAERQHQGFFERAQGGTLFLDEITEMPPALQVKLLRVLESGTFMRVGSGVALESDVRLIAATNRDPQRAVAEGTLREDLMYRLHVFPIEMPALRERPQDIPLLVQHLLQQFVQGEGRPLRATPEALERLSALPWPGNVRELRNVLQRAWVMETGETLSTRWLPEAGARAASAGNGSLPVSVGMSLADVERQVILSTLAHCDQHKERAAALLGVSLKTLYNRLKSYGLTP